MYLLYTDTVFVTRMKLFNITKYAKLRHYLYAYILTCILCSRYICLRINDFTILQCEPENENENDTIIIFSIYDIINDSTQTLKNALFICFISL